MSRTNRVIARGRKTADSGVREGFAAAGPALSASARGMHVAVPVMPFSAPAAAWFALISWRALLAILLLLAVAFPAAAGDAAAAQEGVTTRTLAERELAERVDGHRPLRSNPGTGAPDAAEPPAFHGYPDAPAFSVVPREDQLANYPCEDCHGVMPPNPQPRRLYSPHTAAIEHGSGRIWCLDCHDAENRNVLRTLSGETPSFDEAYRLCGQCHYQPQKDWFYGAHGKRVGNWQGERELYNCTHCHNPHAPAVQPRAPEPPPPVRKGLTPMVRAEHGHDASYVEESHEQ